MSRFQRLYLIIFLVIFFPGCASLQQLASVEKPSVSLDNYRISSLSLKEAEVTFDIKIDNPNPIALNLESYSYQFNIEDNSFLKGTQKSDTQIGANADQIVQLPVRFTYQELFESVKAVVNKDEIAYTFGADLNLDLPLLGLINIPVEQTGTLPVIKLPSLSVRGLDVKKLSFSSADLELDVAFNNPNAFGINLEDVDYNLEINGLTSISGALKQAFQIEKGSTETVKIPISINLLQLGMSAYQAISNKEDFEYTISGSALVDTDLPFFKSSAFNFDKSGLVNILD